jgi:hypothetical protein
VPVYESPEHNAYRLTIPLAPPARPVRVGSTTGRIAGTIRREGGSPSVGGSVAGRVWAGRVRQDGAVGPPGWGAGPVRRDGTGPGRFPPRWTAQASGPGSSPSRTSVGSAPVLSERRVQRSPALGIMSSDPHPAWRTGGIRGAVSTMMRSHLRCSVVETWPTSTEEHAPVQLDGEPYAAGTDTTGEREGASRSSDRRLDAESRCAVNRIRAHFRGGGAETHRNMRTKETQRHREITERRAAMHQNRVAGELTENGSDLAQLDNDVHRASSPR